MTLMLISSKTYTTQSQQLLLTSKSQSLNKMKYIAQAPDIENNYFFLYKDNFQHYYNYNYQLIETSLV